MADSTTMVANKWSEKKMEGEHDALRTLECLRGRLLAERSASRAAKQDADSMATKLHELEEKLKAEAKARRKAEKKLNLLKKKLEALNISYSLEDSAEQSSSSDNFGSSLTSPADQQEEEEEGAMLQSQSSELEFQGSDPSVEGHERLLSEDPCVEGQTLEFGEKCDDLGSSEFSIDNPSHQDLHLRGKSPDSEVHHSRLRTFTVEGMEKDDCVDDNLMALVPISMPTARFDSLTMTEVKATDRHAREVLNTLQKLREMLQSWTESRCLIKVG